MPSHGFERVSLSFSNWLLGGPLVRVEKANDNGHRRSSSHSVLYLKTGSDAKDLKFVKVRRKLPEEGDARSVTKDKDDPPKDLPKKDEDKTKEAITEAEPKKDEAKPKDEKNNTVKTDVKESDGKKKVKSWTEAQDSKIKEMKASNKSWAEICTEVNASKKEVQNRFKKLSGEPESATEPEKKNDSDKSKENKASTLRGVKVKVVVDAEGNTTTSWDDSWHDIGTNGVAFASDLEAKKDTSLGFGEPFKSDLGTNKDGAKEKSDNEELNFENIFDDDNWGTKPEKEDSKNSTSKEKPGEAWDSSSKEKSDETWGNSSKEKKPSDSWGSTSKEKDPADKWDFDPPKENKSTKKDDMKKSSDRKSSRYGKKYDTKYPHQTKNHGHQHHGHHDGYGAGAEHGFNYDSRQFPEYEYVCEDCQGSKNRGYHIYHNHHGAGGSGNNGNSGGDGNNGNANGNGNSGCGGGSSGGANNWNNGGSMGGNGGDQDKWYRNLGLPELRPNKYWSEADVDILMFLEARHGDEKWLQIQAGFYNWTGRMVDADIIKAKFKEDGRY